MNQQPTIQVQYVVSKGSLAKATGVALAVAAVLLGTVVLPAEYGIDPLGTGRMLGLTALSAPPSLPEEAVRDSAKLTPVQEGAISHYASSYKFDSAEFTIAPYDYVEYKYRLEKGASMEYAWTANSEVIQDFHGARDSADSSNTEESYDKRQRHEAFGSLLAPFDGIHGWYWENPGGTPITVKLKTAGFYSSAVEIRSDRTRHNRDLTDLDKVTVSKASSTTGS
jgi:hypothetical protein